MMTVGAVACGLVGLLMNMLASVAGLLDTAAMPGVTMAKAQDVASTLDTAAMPGVTMAKAQDVASMLDTAGLPGLLSLAKDGLNVSGWIMMILAVGGVTCFFAWCLYRVLSSRESTEHIHSPSDIDTHDHED